MHHIIYLSTATPPPTDEELALLLAQCRRNNEALQVTGALVYGGGQFMQVMEGPKAAVQQLYHRVENDPRHTGLMKLADKDVPERSFGNWYMAYEAGRPAAMQHLAGYLSPAELLRHLPASQSAADDLLYAILRATVDTPSQP